MGASVGGRVRVWIKSILVMVAGCGGGGSMVVSSSEG